MNEEAKNRYIERHREEIDRLLKNGISMEEVNRSIQNLMESGEAKYANLSVGSDFTLIMDRDYEGVHITNRIRDDEMIAEMAESGLPVEEIAEILGLSEEEVQSALNFDDEEE